LLPLAAQQRGVRLDMDEERVGTPANQPEQRKRIGDDPARIFEKLLSKSESARRTAATQLKWHVAEFPEPLDARLFIVNLDADAEAEVIFVLSGTPASTVALVFDRRDNAWWQVGEFSYSWQWDPNVAEKLIELREIVAYRRKDLIVRERAGGTGVATTHLAIYRMHNGRLYKVFQTPEEEFYYVHGGGRTITEERQVEFPEPDSSGKRFLVVRHVKTTEPDVPTRQNSRQRVRGCSAFRWDSSRFIFARHRASAARLCNKQ
jgi:hypothetical protein